MKKIGLEFFILQAVKGLNAERCSLEDLFRQSGSNDQFSIIIAQQF
jgi:hypothetical protein